MLGFLFKSTFSIVAAVIVGQLLRILQHRIKQLPLRNIPSPPGRSILTGHLRQLFNSESEKNFDSLLLSYGSVVRLGGFVGDSLVFVADPRALEQILVKDSDIFEHAEQVLENRRCAWGPGLFSVSGARHHKQRKLLNPAFSAARMRDLTPLFHGIAEQLRDALLASSAYSQEIDAVKISSRLALEMIGQGGFGYTFGPLDGIDNEFRAVIKQYAPASNALAIPKHLLPLVSKVFPARILRFLGESVPWPTLNHVIKVLDSIHMHSRAIYEKKASLIASGDATTKTQLGMGKDILSILVKGNMGPGEGLEEEEIVAQIATLIFAATDTTSSALSRVLHLLSLHQDVQHELRREIRNATSEGDLSYDKLMALPYLEAICKETLRLYPPVLFSVRTARKDTVIPTSTAVRGLDGREMHEIFIPKNTNVGIGILNVNREPSIWGQDSREWKPERWFSPVRGVADARVPGVYSNMMTFAAGRRSCIGFKFAELEMKVVLAHLIPTFHFTPVKEILWISKNFMAPYTKASDGSLKLELPVRITRL